ncbi:MAG: acyl-CoA synthetase FdrA [Hyphomicrobiaceae bacterium]
MSVVVNEVRRGFYLDSVALMRMSRGIVARNGVEEAGMMMGTPANKRIMADAGVLNATGEAAQPGDLVIALRACDQLCADDAMAEARSVLDKPRGNSGATGESGQWTPRTIRAAHAQMPDANLALISVPGAFAAAEGRKALNRGINVLMFSDNVPVVDEVELKQLARERGLLMMGPDCGTAIINGVPLGFANVVPRGDIGIVGASGTGIQEVSCLLAQNGLGISHALGTGGRDLKADVGGITMLMGIELLDADAATRHIVIISKPPADSVARVVLERVGQSVKPFTVCFIGVTDMAMPANATLAPTLERAAQLASGANAVPDPRSALSAKGKHVRGLFAGGTMCAEAQVVFRDAGLKCVSNVAIPGVGEFDGNWRQHALIDLGDDDYTAGRPHPMIEPAVRDEPLLAALKDADVGVVLIDFVLGFGAHADPAGHLVAALGARGVGGTVIVASVTGTEADPQRRSSQVRILEAAGIIVAPSNASAARIAVQLVRD